LLVSLQVDEDSGYFSQNGDPYVAFTTGGTNILLTNTTALSVYGQDAVGNVSVTNTYNYTNDVTAPVVTVAPGTTNFSSTLLVSLQVNEDSGYFSQNGDPYVAFTTGGTNILLTNTTALLVYGQDVLGNVSATNNHTYTLNPPPILTGVVYANGSLSFSVTNAGGVYRVQTHTNLANPAGWITLSTNTAPFTVTVTNQLGGSRQRFYRVVAP
jgi:hypothetical protein